MGGGKGGSTTNNISKTEIPPEVLARYNAVNARAEAVAQQPYQKYSNDPNAFVAGLTPTQQAGIQNTNLMAGAAQPFYQAGAAATLSGMQNVGPLTQQQIGYYQNPYTQAVVNPTLQALQQQQRQQLAEQQAQAIRGGAFGGDRAGLARAQLMGQQNLAQAQAIAPLYQQGYNTALQTAAGQQNVIGADLARMMTGGQQLANLGMGAQQAGLAGAQAQMQAGQAQQQTEQAGKQAMYNQFMQEQGYPFQVAQFLANIATGTGALSGNTTAGTSTTTGGGGFFSDKRLKENVEKVGETNDGQPIYRYNYKGDPRTQIGLMAQDVEKEHPEAVGLAGGYKTVDYKKATQDAVRKQGGGGLMPQMLTPEIEAGDTSPEFEAGDVTPENMDAAYSTSTPNPISGWGPRQDAAVALRGSWRDLPASRLTNTPDDRNSSLSGEMWRAPGARYGRATGGTTDAYTINPAVENSQMLDRPAGLGALALPQMMTGASIPVRSMTPASEIAGLLAPKATGFSPGTLESARAQRATLGSALAGGNEEKLNMGSGRGYIQSEYDRLGKFLEPYDSQYSSQGGLVGPEGGAFARGGYAFGGGPYGVELTPMQQRQMLQGTPMVAPQVRQPDPIGDATKMAGLVSGGYKLYKDRPDFLRSAEDVAKRKQEELYREKVREEYLKKHGVEPEKVAELTPEEAFSMPEYAARGGLIGNRDGFYGRGYVNPDSYISGVLEDQSQAPAPRKLASNAMDFNKSQKPQNDSGALGQLTQMASLGKNLYSGGNWAAGKLGLGASPTAMSATSTGVIPEVIDMTSVPLTSAPLIEGAAAADAAAAAAGATGAAEGLGLMGTLGTIGEGIAAALPFLGFLSDERAKHDIKKVGTLFDGQPVYRYAYNGDDKTQMGLLAQKVEKTHPEAVGLAGGMKTVDYEKATDKAAKRGHYQSAGGVPVVVPDEYSTAEPDLAPVRAPETPVEPPVRGARAVAPAPGLGAAPPPRPVQVGDNQLTVVPRASIPDTTGNAMPAPRPAKPVEPGVAAARRPSIPDVGGLVPEGMKDTLSSENFWVPALAGIGSMLASPNKTFLGALGSGLVGGTTAYTNLEKQNADIAKQRIEGLKNRFVGPTLINGQMMYRDTWRGDNITPQEYSARVSQHITGKTPGAASPAAVTTARKVIEEGAPEVERPAVTATPRATTENRAEGAAPATGAPPAAGATPAAAPPPAAGSAATGATPAPAGNLIAMDQAMLDNEELWKGLPPPMRPKALLNDAAAMDAKIRRLEANRAAIEQEVGETEQSKAISAEIASLRTDREAKIARAQQQMSRATKLQEDAALAEIKRKSAVQEEADKIELLPRKQQLELQGEIGKRGALDPLDIAQKQREADIQRAREVQTARDKLPIEEEKVAFDANVKRQDAALQKAAADAKEAQIARSQAQAALSVMFDKNGKPVISGGPLGTKIANVAAYMSQLGFSDKFIEDLTKTKPSNAQALAKLQTAMAAEIARLEFNGAPVRQSEFLQFLQTTPGATLLPEAFKWIVEKTIIPKTEASINAYKRVKDFTPGIGKGANIEGELFDYYDQNPWFRNDEARLGEAPARRTSNRAPVPELTDEEKAQLAQEIRQRRASQGTR